MDYSSPSSPEIYDSSDNEQFVYNPNMNNESPVVSHAGSSSGGGAAAIPLGLPLPKAPTSNVPKPPTLTPTAPEEIFTAAGQNKDITLVKYTCDWNFIAQNNTEVVSPQFVIGRCQEFKAFLNYEERTRGHRYMSLDFVSLGSESIAKVTFEIISAEGETLHLKIGERFNNGPVRQYKPAGNFNTVLRGGVKKSTERRGIVRCTILLLSGKSISTQQENPNTQLLKSFASLHNSNLFTDASFVLGDVILHAHKAVLAARSQVFRAMFENNMRESTSSVVEIEDASVEGFEELLRFIYTGQVKSMGDFAEELLALAEKYELLDLKAMCEVTLAQSLSVDNAAHTIVLADRYRAGRLKAEAVVYIHKRRSAVKESEGWKRAKKEHSKVIAEAFLEY